jgi:hypothetical protein
MDYFLLVYVVYVAAETLPRKVSAARKRGCVMVNSIAQWGNGREVCCPDSQARVEISAAKGCRQRSAMAR